VPLLAVLLAVVIIVVLAVGTILSDHATDLAVARYEALHKADTANLRVLQEQIDEETGIRGYASSGDRVLLAPYTAAHAELAGDFAQLREALIQAGMSSLLPRVDEMASLNRIWEANVAAPTLRSSDVRATAQFQIGSKTILDRFRVVDGGMQQALLAQLRSVFRMLTARIRTTIVTSAWLIALASVIVAVVAVIGSRTRVRLEKEIRHKEVLESVAAQLRTLIEAIPEIVWFGDEPGRAAYFNQRWYDYTGQDEATALNDGWLVALHPEDAVKAFALWKESVRTGKPYEIEYRLRGADGEYHWFSGRALAERDAEGEIVRWLGTCTDVDATHQHLEALQRVADAFAQAQLPQSLPSNTLVHFDATYVPAEDLAQVGGDWYDVFSLDADRFFFSLGDVTGHGLQAALTMSRVRQAFVAFASVANEPAAILERANRVLRMHDEGMVTALCGVFNARTGDLTYASAGHPPAILLGANGSLREVTSSAPPLGVLDGIEVEQVHEHLGVGDRLICYTDGIVENEHDYVRGEMRLRTVLGQLTPFEFARPARSIRERILGGRRGRDDVALLVLSRPRQGVGSAPNEPPGPAAESKRLRFTTH